MLSRTCLSVSSQWQKVVGARPVAWQVQHFGAPMGTLHALPAGCLHLQPPRPVLLVAHVPGIKGSREHAARLRCRVSVAQEQAAPISRGCPEPALREAVAFAPATVANLGPGFDWLGCAVEVRALLGRAPQCSTACARPACPELTSACSSAYTCINLTAGPGGHRNCTAAARPAWRGGDRGNRGRWRAAVAGGRGKLRRHRGAGDPEVAGRPALRCRSPPP